MNKSCRNIVCVLGPLYCNNRSSRNIINNIVGTVFLTVDAKSSGPSISAIGCHVHSALLQKNNQSVKGPNGVSTAGTPMPKLKPKRNIVLRITINQYAQ